MRARIVWENHSDGGALRVLGSVLVSGLVALIAASSATTSFPGANGKLVVVQGRSVALVNADGSELEPIAEGFDPSWSPDGTRIAFATAVSSCASCSSIAVMAADGNGQTRITDGSGGDTSPVWSPDGTKIAFNSGRGGSLEIWTMNADGSAPTQLTNDFWGNVTPAWSPDGTRIAFTGSRPGVGPRIWIVNADGTGERQLTSPVAGVTMDEAPTWSPDGTRIAFVSTRSGTWELWAMTADGGGLTQLTTGGPPQVCRERGCQNALWTPS